MHRSKRMAALMGVIAALALTLLGGTTAAAQSDADDPAQIEAGMAVFETNCAGCHGVDGMGSNQGRNLTDVATEADRLQHFTSITDGKGNMPAFGERLTVEERDAAISYVRLTFTTQVEPELAVTGATTAPMTIVGLIFLGAGLMIVVLAHRSASRYARTTG